MKVWAYLLQKVGELLTKCMKAHLRYEKRIAWQI